MEPLCSQRAARGGRVAIARPFTVAGEGQRSDRAIATWIESMRAGQAVTVLGFPERTRDVSDVRDVVRALIAWRKETYRVTLADIVFAVSEALALLAFLEIVPARTEDVTATRADTTLCVERLGVEFGTDLRALVRRQVEGTTAIHSTLQEVG